ncbi:MAG: MarC family protein [Polyangiaceae bacterium]
MKDLFSFAVLCFSSLFVIIDPIAVAPVFVSMTDGQRDLERRRSAVRACAVALGVLLLFAIGGGLIFRLFGITMEAFRIAGGILFFVMAMKMLAGDEHRAGVPAGGDGAAVRAAAGGDPAVVPLGVPLICGPGAISTVMVLMGQSNSAARVASLLSAIVLVVAATALVLVLSPHVLRRFGKTGVALTTRMMGLLCCVIGIQFVIDGVRPIAIGILSAAAR